MALYYSCFDQLLIVLLVLAMEKSNHKKTYFNQSKIQSCGKEIIMSRSFLTIEIKYVFVNKHDWSTIAADNSTRHLIEVLYREFVDNLLTISFFVERLCKEK